MKKKSTSQSAFFNLRVLIGLFIVVAGVVLALVGFGTFSAQAQQKPKIIVAPELGIFSPGFDCSKIHEQGLDRQENFRAGGIMIACGESPGGSPDPDAPSSKSSGSATDKLIQSLLPSPLFIGGGDVDVIPPDGTFPHVTQSESMEWCGANNTCVVNYNDSRTNGSCYAGLSYSTDNGVTWHVANAALCSGHGTNFGDPNVVYNAHLGMWFAGDLATGCGGQGIGLWTSPDGITWTTGACAYNTGNGDRESMWVDNNPASPHYGRMYISLNDFAVGGGALRVVYSDNGTTWTTVQLNPAFIRDVQVTGDLGGSGRVYVAAMNEEGGSIGTRQNQVYRSTDGGATWASSTTGPAFQSVGRSNCTANSYFVCMFGTNNWRHMGWGEPTANGNFVGLDYAQKGAGSDLGDIYFVRSTDAGVTWGTPVKLNTDSGTAMQWQPSMAATQAGAIFASWYDQREVNGGADLNCTAGSSSQNCYRRWGRLSFDNGATWQPDDQVGRALSPLPGQPDSAVQPNYQGDYDYHSSNGTNIIGGWTDGRVIISGQSQQDVFVNFVTGGFGVTSSVPACASVIGTQPQDFVINLSAAVDPATVQPSDFTVNGTPANSDVLSNGNTTITFHFNSSPVVTQGAQTMHIAAGAFNDATAHPVADFSCTFCYAITPLMVTSTVPAVGGNFTPPAPGNYNYDVNFNQAVDPASVQDSDLTVSGNSGPSVTGHSLINGNTTVRFTLHMNFGGALTASLGAGAVAANTCNGNAAFSGNYTVDGCPPADHYVISQIGGSIVPGTTDIGNHADDGVTNISLPFSYTLYGTTYSSVNVSSNGNAQFVTVDNNWVNSCPLPWTTHDGTIFPYWDDQRTDMGTGTGIFTSTTGVMPNRIFNIEWRTVYFNNTAQTANYELRLYEGQARFDVIYGTLAQTNTSATAGVQKNDTAFDQYFCNGSGSPATGGQSYILTPCTGPNALSAVSRITHTGGCGTFDVPMPLTCPSGVECRNTGGNYTLVVNFDQTIATAGSASVVCHNPANGTGTAGAPTASGTTVSIPLTGVSNGQVLNVQLSGVNGTGSVTIPFGVLLGDTNGNRAVNAGDVAQTKAQSGNPVTAANFRNDVNANCAINAGDVAFVKSQSGITSAPNCCP